MGPLYQHHAGFVKSFYLLFCIYFCSKGVCECAEPTLKHQHTTLRQVLSSAWVSQGSLRGHCSKNVQRQVQSRYFSQGSEQSGGDTLQTYITLSYILLSIYL